VVLRSFRGALVLAVLSLLGDAGEPLATRLVWAQQPGSLRGHVEVGHLLAAGRPAPRPGSLDAAGADADVYRQAVVYIDPPPDRLERPSEVRVRMNQKDERFIPHLLAIPTGSTVDFPNEDRTFHNVFSLSKARRFDLGRYAAGQSKAVRFDRPGIVRVFCEIHSHMNAFILVFDHRYFAVTDDNGRFRIDRVPPGTYRVTAWYEGAAKQTQTVTVAASTGADVNFELR